MAWQCRMVEFSLTFNGRTMQIGDMFYADLERWRREDGYLPWPLQMAKPDRLSSYYKENNSHRLPLIVVLPGKAAFCVDAMCYDGERGHYGGWTVSGEAPNITVSPSINIGGTYHGWINAGIISDDVEGRKFDPTTGHLLCQD